MDYSQILIRIRQIVRSVNLESKRLEKEHGISIPQLLCLRFLDQQNDFQATHKQIKDFLQLNASTVTGIIKRLERKGLVARLPKREDRRVGYVTITALGKELLNRFPEPLHEQLSEKLSGMSGQQLAELQRAFDVITQFMDVPESDDSAPIVTAGLASKEDGISEAPK